MVFKLKACFALIFILILSISVCFATDINRTALVIGNWRYVGDPLKNPSNDVRDMEVVLKKLDFEVISVKNATKEIMENNVRKFKEQLSYKGGVGLFYYAGHAMQINGVNYLVGIEGKNAAKFDLLDNCLQVDELMGSINAAKNKFNIVILDACRDNPFLDSVNGVGPKTRSARGILLEKKVGLASIKAPSKMFIAFSTAPGSVASDGSGKNGVYTKYLLEEMQTPGLSLEQVFKKVRANVFDATNGAQIPWEHSSLVEEFYFISPPKEKREGGKRRLFGAF